MNEYKLEYLRQLQAMPLEIKIMKSRQRIFEFVSAFSAKHVHVCFSGGKDSLVLLHLVRSVYPQVKAVYFKTGVDWPELTAQVEATDNIDIINPEMSIVSVIKKYGYPMVSKEIAKNVHDYIVARSERTRTNRRNLFRGIGIDGKEEGYRKKRYVRWEYLLDAPFKISHKCCDVLKKNPAKKYEQEHASHPILGTLADESMYRRRSWLKHGCNSFSANGCTTDKSQPLAFWTDSDILEYAKNNNIKLPSIYGDIVFDNGKYKCTGMRQTGCMYCGFGCHHKNDHRFEILEKLHPEIYDYAMRGGEMVDGTFIPAKGLGLGFVINWIMENKEKAK